MDAARSNFTPKVSQERIGISYSFKFPGSGLFECSLTGLVFTVTREGEVTYKTLIWDDRLLEPVQKMAGGPLFGIKCPQDSISQLHLPHCEPQPALVSGSLSVIDITDDGLNFIQPLQITETHVVVNVPHLSAFGIVWDVVKRFKDFKTIPINCQTLPFLIRKRCPRNSLSFVLLPSNVPLQDVKAQHADWEFILAPSFCRFHMNEIYSFHSDPGGFTLQPKKAEFYEEYGPNYSVTFEILLPPSVERITVTIKDPKNACVWEHDIQLPAPPSAAEPGTSSTQ
ncbi:NACHT, LRR and PYD domains-containing protein 1b allele 5-like [Odontesthes bonariensis]|uniref:NACHT, LRR and PYD domains-containing protein 1b allele 5-like n=1 Tax=Odontesthes bonariensis TaxID=219752 RepID=UPI003F58B263